MEELFRDYWWLAFPLMGFAFAGFGAAMHAQLQRDRMAILRTYAEKGQVPPPELTANPYGPACDPPYGYGYGRRRWRREMRRAYRGPARDWRRFVFFLAISMGFLAAALWDGGVRDHRGYVIVAIITGALSLGSLLAALPMMRQEGLRADIDAQLGK